MEATLAAKKVALVGRSGRGGACAVALLCLVGCAGGGGGGGYYAPPPQTTYTPPPNNLHVTAEPAFGITLWYQDNAGLWQVWGNPPVASVFDPRRPQLRAARGMQEVLFRLNGPGNVHFNFNRDPVEVRGPVEILQGGVVAGGASAAASPSHPPAQQPAPSRPYAQQPPPIQPNKPAPTASGLSPQDWANRAIPVLRQLLQDRTYQSNLASAVQTYLHPSGKSPRYGGATVGLRLGTNNTVVVQLTANWAGGVLGTNYQTVVEWSFTSQAQTAVQVASDNSPVQPTASAKQQLLSYLESYYADLKQRVR